MTNNPDETVPVEQCDRDAEAAEQFGKDFRAEQASNFGCGGEIECCFPMDGNCGCFNAVLARHRRAAQSPPPVVSEGVVAKVVLDRHREDIQACLDNVGKHAEQTGMSAAEASGREYAWAYALASISDLLETVPLNMPALSSPSRGCDLDTVEAQRAEAFDEAARIAINHSNYGHIEGNKRAFTIARDLEHRAAAIRNLGKEGDAPPLPGHDRLGRGG